MERSGKKGGTAKEAGTKVTRRSFLKGVGALGLGLAATPSMNKLAFAQAKGPLKLSSLDMAESPATYLDSETGENVHGEE